MPPEVPTEQRSALLERISELQFRLDDAEETLRALRSGEVDAIVASGPEGDKVYTLKGADETYRVMVQGMAEGALTLTIDGLILFANDQFAALLARLPERLAGTRFQDFVAPADIAAAGLLLASPLRNKAEVHLLHSAGHLVPVYLSVQRILLDAVECICLIVTDLSAQKRYEDLLAIMEAAPVAVFIARDAECRTLVANRMACAQLRIPIGENAPLQRLDPATRGTFRGFQQGSEVPEYLLPVPLAARTGVAVRDQDLEILFDDGTTRAWLGNAVPLFDEAGASRGAVGAFLDVTDRKRAREALEAGNAELRQFVEALTGHLKHPLGNLLDSTRRLAVDAKGRLGHAAEHQLTRTTEAALRLETLLNALLHYWQVTERNADQLAPVDCNLILGDALLTLELEMRQDDVIVTCDPLPAIVADEVMLRELFFNLVNNAIRFRSAESPRIHFSAVRAGERWLFTVRDNGMGIDKRDIPQLFAIFHRLDAGSYPGAGIGLAMCKKIVERHGGRIWVESEPGQGAAFRFTLPVFLEDALPGFSASA